MCTEELKKLNELANKTRKEKRSKEDIADTFRAAGIIDSNGSLKSPYKNIFVSSQD